MHGCREAADGDVQRTILHGTRGANGVVLHLKARAVHSAIVVGYVVAQVFLLLDVALLNSGVHWEEAWAWAL